MMRKLGIKNIRYSGRQQSLKYYIGFSQKFTDKRLVDQFSQTFRSLHKRGVIQGNRGEVSYGSSAIRMTTNSRSFSMNCPGRK
jgi:hypothetical protein